MMNDKVKELKKILDKQKKASAPAPEKEIESFLAKENDLEKELDDIKVKLAEQKTEYLRKLAEFENFKKRLSKEKEEVIRYANESLLVDFFPVLDSFEMTLSHISLDQKSDPVISGIELVYKQFLEILKKSGLEEITGEGEAFNPNFQEAMSTEKSEGQKSGTVLKVHRKGFKLKGRVLRAALVTVAK